MKNLFTKFAILILSLGVLYACEKNETPDQMPQSYPEMEVLSSEISNYIANFDEQTTTRRNGWAWVNAGFADYGGWMIGRRAGFWVGLYCGGVGGAAAGYFVGAIAVAGIASAAALLATNSARVTGNTLYNDYNDFDDFGTEHNIFVNAIIQRQNEFMIDGEMNKDKFLATAKVIALEMHYNEMEDFDMAYLNTLLSETEKLSFDEECVTNYFDNLIVKYPEETATLNLQKQYTLKAVALNSVEDLTEFSEGYEKIVVDAPIMQKDKEDLLTSSSLLKNSLVAYTMEQ